MSTLTPRALGWRVLGRFQFSLPLTPVSIISGCSFLPPNYATHDPKLAHQNRHMAGHNKWSKIKRKKAANDKSRAAVHSKAARAIEAASRACNGDLEDLHLQSAISHAKSVQLSKERLQNAVERGANPQLRGEGEELILRRYDGMIPGGENGKVAVIIEALTENRNRTAANVRHLVTKIGGELLPTGSNDWIFEHVGVITVSREINPGEDGDCGNDIHITGVSQIEQVELEEEKLLECALDGGATDVEFEFGRDCNGSDGEEEPNHAIVKCEPPDLLGLVHTLKINGFSITQFEKQWVVKDEGSKTVLDAEGLKKFEKFFDTMEEDFDVSNVFHNALPPEDFH
mmetsp:Transcript_17210/g.35937  ORF Transcript_17210/g.35937 Transcript_17210/m.35937 type:complete len:343 (+) Transcript_17210:394-1422(+)